MGVWIIDKEKCVVDWRLKTWALQSITLKSLNMSFGLGPSVYVILSKFRVRVLPNFGWSDGALWLQHLWCFSESSKLHVGLASFSFTTSKSCYKKKIPHTNSFTDQEFWVIVDFCYCGITRMHRQVTLISMYPRAEIASFCSFYSVSDSMGRLWSVTLDLTPSVWLNLSPPSTPLSIRSFGIMCKWEYLVCNQSLLVTIMFIHMLFNGPHST